MYVNSKVSWEFGGQVVIHELLPFTFLLVFENDMPA
jgi:hypothetical protein